MTSSMSAPMRSLCGSFCVRRVSTRSAPGNSTYPTPKGTKVASVSALRYGDFGMKRWIRSEEHTSELQSHLNLVCRLLLEKKKVQYHHWSISVAYGCVQ